MIGWRRPRRAGLKPLLIVLAVFAVWCVWAYWPVIMRWVGW